MADRSISELPTASTIGATDLFVLQQANAAKKLTGQALENWLLQMADGRGGIQSISKTSSTGSNPVVDTYTITFADTTTSTFTVTNGLKGDTGAQTYVHVKYSAVQPTRDADIGDIPDEWMGIYIGLASVAPTHYTDYTWNKVRGEKGDTGAAAVITAQSVQYQASNSGTVIPTGTWSNSIPAVTEGQYLWTRTIVTYNSGTTTTAYSVGYKGINGTGAGDMAKSAYDPQGSVEAAGGIPSYVYSQVPSAAQQNPQMDGQANVGSSSDYARADHMHPTDTTRAKTDLSNVSNGSVKTAMLDTDSVTAPKIADGAVTRSKLASDVKVLRFTDTTVGTAAWASDTTYTDFPYRAPIACSGVTVNHYVEVIFSPTDAMSGTFCPVTASYAGGVYIYASEIPGATVTIPTIVCTPVA